MQRVYPHTVGFSPERLSRLDDAMQRYVDKGQIAGLVVLLAREGKLFHSGCYGMAEIEKGKAMQPNSIFRLWSITKALVTVAALVLYEQGYFVLDQDIAEFIPAFKDTKVCMGVDGDDLILVERQAPITIRSLMMHTSGIASGFQMPDNPAEQVMAAMRRGISPFAHDLEYVVEKMAAVPLIYQPNTRWFYSASFEVVARLVEVISGQKFMDFIHENVFAPLSMVDTGFFVNDAQLLRFTAFYNVDAATGGITLGESSDASPDYLPDDKPMPEKVWTNASGGAVGTPEDIWRFAEMLRRRGEFDGTRVLAPRTVDLMTANHMHAALLPYGFPEGLPMVGYGHGLGVHVLMDHGEAGLPCANGEYWKDGGSGTLFWVDPSYDLTGVVMYQLNPFNKYPVWAQVRALTYQAMV